MKTFTGHQEAESGLYLNLKTWSITTLEADGLLPGDAAVTYRRVPMLLMLAAAPLLGLAFVMFLPFIGFAMVAQLLGTKVVHLAKGTMGETDRVRRPGWVPARAFLSRPKHEEPVKPADAANAADDAWTKSVGDQLEKTDHPES